MAKIFRKNQAIKVKIDDAIFEVVPLSISQKNEITSKLSGAQKGGLEAVGAMLDATRLACKYAIKGLKGVTDGSGEPYALQFNDDGTLVDECLEDLSNFESSDKLNQTLLSLSFKFGQQPTDPDGKPVEGVVVNYVEKNKSGK